MTAATTPRRRLPTGVSDIGWAALFVLPLFAGVVLFYLWPIVRNIWFSFTEWGRSGSRVGRAGELPGVDH